MSGLLQSRYALQMRDRRLPKSEIACRWKGPHNAVVASERGLGVNGGSWSGKRLGVVGAGNMAEALVRGVVRAGLIPAGMIHAFDPLPGRRAVFASLGCRVADAPAEAAACDVVLLAVKPQAVRAALLRIAPLLRRETVLISIAAGVPIRILAEILPAGVKLARIMPNTPLLVGFGMSCVAPGPGLSREDAGMILDLFSSAGDAVEVDEDQLDAVTALSGSGPAYLFRFAEALQEAGEALGLSPALSRRLGAATLRGAAEMLAAGGDPAGLREKVTSPGGTTAAALGVLDNHDFMGIIAEALKAAERRAGELGRQA